MLKQIQDSIKMYNILYKIDQNIMMYLSEITYVS